MTEDGFAQRTVRRAQPSSRGCRDDMRIVREEIFGPVMSILVFDDEDEVIARANDTDYGLAAGVVTENLARAHRVIHRLEAGICWINTWGESPAEMPVGGYKQSGVGRENGITTLEHYTRIKSVQVELGPYQPVFWKESRDERERIRLHHRRGGFGGQRARLAPDRRRRRDRAAARSGRPRLSLRLPHADARGASRFRFKGAATTGPTKPIPSRT